MVAAADSAAADFAVAEKVAAVQVAAADFVAAEKAAVAAVFPVQVRGEFRFAPG